MRKFLITSLVAVSIGSSLCQAADSSHSMLAAQLSDHENVRRAKERLASQWQILGMSTVADRAQAELVGRLLVSAARPCGLEISWDPSVAAPQNVWPVALDEVTTRKIEQVLTAPWSVAGEAPPTYLNAAAENLRSRVESRGIARMAISSRDRQVDFVFLDGSEVDANNDMAMLSYSLLSTIAGLEAPEETVVTPNFTFMTTGGQLDAAAGTNEQALGNICRTLPLIEAMCDGTIEKSSQSAIEAGLQTTLSQCAPDGEVMRRLEQLHEEILEYFSRQQGDLN
jgi:hypothetical protein